jgi:hypothetical protein
MRAASFRDGPKDQTRTLEIQASAAIILWLGASGAIIWRLVHA